MSECNSNYLEKILLRDEDKSHVTERVLSEIDKWLERFDCLVVGPGLGRDPFLLVRFGKIFILCMLCLIGFFSNFSKLGVSLT